MNAWLIKRPRGNNNNNSGKRMSWSSRRQTASGFVMLTARMEWDVHGGNGSEGGSVAVAEMLMRSSMRLANYFPSTQTMPICSARSKRRNMVD